MSKQQESPARLIAGTVMVLLVLGLPLYGIVLHYCFAGNWTHMGSFGDAYGGFSGLAATVAAAAAIYALVDQMIQSRAQQVSLAEKERRAHERYQVTTGIQARAILLGLCMQRISVFEGAMEKKELSDIRQGNYEPTANLRRLYEERDQLESELRVSVRPSPSTK